MGLCPFSDPAADFAPSKPARLPVKGGEENAGDKGTRELRTGRLTLRRFVLPDADVMFQNYAADGRVTRFLSWEPYQSAEEVRRFVASVIGAYGREDFYHWAIEFEGQIVGSISAIGIDERNGCCEVGYCIACDQWNRGITTEALKAAMSFLFAEVGFRRITAKHDIENLASGAVMKKCGMLYEGRLREHYRRHDGSYGDALAYGILKKEFLGGAGESTGFAGDKTEDLNG